MASLFSSPDIPEPKLPMPPKVDDNTLQNASNSEKQRRARALGKQQSIFAGDLMGAAPVLRPTLG